MPRSDQFAFFGVEDSNFLNNSGSYFVILAGIIVYYLFTYIINKICVCCAKRSIARKIGMLVYEENYWNQFVKSSYKLFLESFFDLVICSLINVFAFFNSADKFSTFFESWENIGCSTLSIVYSILIIFFPLMAWRSIQYNQGRLKLHQSDFVRVIMEGVDPHSYHASMFTVYFLVRRLFTGFILIAL